MLRYLTAGESHGKALVVVLEGLPAGVPLTTAEVAAGLARRRLGYGRGKRMRFEQDRCEVLGGLRHGRTRGWPLAVRIDNSEWPKWTEVMARDPPAAPAAAASGRGAPLTRPRPGHADLTGMQKYGFGEARPVLERASARETAARVAAGAAARAPCPGPATWTTSTPHRSAASTATPRAAWSPRSTPPGRLATPSAASSRWSRTACRPAWAPTSTGTAS